MVYNAEYTLYRKVCQSNNLIIKTYWLLRRKENVAHFLFFATVLCRTEGNFLAFLDYSWVAGWPLRHRPFSASVTESHLLPAAQRSKSIWGIFFTIFGLFWSNLKYEFPFHANLICASAPMPTWIQLKQLIHDTRAIITAALTSRRQERIL